MKILPAHEQHYVLSFARGEELCEALPLWCEEKGIEGATFTGLGAADQLEVGYYHIPSKKFERTPIEEEIEILSLTGNVAVLDGKKILHVHGVFGRRDLSTFGGHVFRTHLKINRYA